MEYESLFTQYDVVLELEESDSSHSGASRIH